MLTKLPVVRDILESGQGSYWFNKIYWHIAAVSTLSWQNKYRKHMARKQVIEQMLFLYHNSNIFPSKQNFPRSRYFGWHFNLINEEYA